VSWALKVCWLWKDKEKELQVQPMRFQGEKKLSGKKPFIFGVVTELQ